MNRFYHIRVLQVTPATKDMLIDMSKIRIKNSDFFRIYVCTDLMAEVLPEVVAALKDEFDTDTIKKHISVRVPFAYRKLRPLILPAFSLD